MRPPARTINQPTLNPTNKLTAATIATSAVSVTGLILKNLAPEWYDPDVMLSMMPIVAFGVGWLIPDRPNVAISQETQS